LALIKPGTLSLEEEEEEEEEDIYLAQIKQ